jgi:hypothetical protein
MLTKKFGALEFLINYLRTGKNFDKNYNDHTERVSFCPHIINSKISLPTHNKPATSE